MPNQAFPNASDTILRHKDENNVESIIFPITRYANIMNSPKVVSNISDAKSAPYVLLQTDSVQLTNSEINSLFSIS